MIPKSGYRFSDQIMLNGRASNTRIMGFNGGLLSLQARLQFVEARQAGEPVVRTAAC